MSRTTDDLLELLEGVLLTRVKVPRPSGGLSCRHG